MLYLVGCRIVLHIWSVSCFWAPTPKILVVFRVINTLFYVTLADRGSHSNTKDGLNSASPTQINRK